MDPQMITQSLDVELREIVLSNSSFGPNEIARISSVVSNDYTQFAFLKDLVGELVQDENRSPATSVRLGVCQYLLGRYRSSIETLTNADGGAVACFYLGKCYFACEDYQKAVEAYDNAKKGGYNDGFCTISTAEAKRYGEDPQGAMELLDQLFGPIEQTADYLYQRGATVAALGSNPSEVVALYERAVELDPTHAGALFGLALENDRRGNDDDALDLYQRAANCFPSNVGSLLNLGLLYEDQTQYDRAQRCYSRILDIFPTHPQADLYNRDVLASGGKSVDPELEYQREKMQNILKTPVTDFELSVRSRNCLEKMGIITVGDLTQVTEQELLGSKNFGETSLDEIRDMLTARGLRIGQFAHEAREAEEKVDLGDLSPEEQSLMDRPIAELNLSVRARKCMTRLGLTTIGELVRKTGDEMLECKNFGVTSLNEVREKLGQIGLKLRGD